MLSPSVPDRVPTGQRLVAHAARIAQLSVPCTSRNKWPATSEQLGTGVRLGVIHHRDFLCHCGTEKLRLYRSEVTGTASPFQLIL